MTDFATFFQSDEFKAYRRKQAEQVAMFIEDKMRRLVNGGNTSEDISACHGAMDMARLLIDLPERLIKDQGVITNLKKQKVEDIAGITSFLVRRHMVNE